jgi:predicted phage tail protein
MSNNETSFEIERKTGSAGTWARVLTTGANISTIDDVGLSASTTCFYRVRAMNSTGASGYSNEVSATTAAPPSPAPAVPTHFAAAVLSATAVDLSWWDMSNNETGFEIERKTGAAGAWTRVLTTAANISTIDDVGLTPSTTYFYRSRAVNGPSASGYSNEVSLTTPAPPPAAPINLTIQSTAHLRISVTWWDMSNNETGFEVQRKTGSAGAWSSLATRGANISIVDDWSVRPGVFYVYRVRALGAVGPSAWSNELSATAW